MMPKELVVASYHGELFESQGLEPETGPVDATTAKVLRWKHQPLLGRLRWRAMRTIDK